MKGLIQPPPFPGFGPNRLDTGNKSPDIQRVEGQGPKYLAREVRGACPRVPGVYGMLDRDGELIYVGKAKSLRIRLLSYFRVKSRDPKAGRIIRRSRSILWEECSSEFGALLRELELIRRWRPRLNVQGVHGRRQPKYLCVGRPKAPGVFLSEIPPADTQACFGPLRGGYRVIEAVRQLNDLFKLRDCPQHQEMLFAERTEIPRLDLRPGCIRYEIGTCLGPCVAACTRTDYSAQVRNAMAFMAGADLSPLDSLRVQMADASNAFAFEQAARLRDKIESLSWLRLRLDWLQNARKQQSFVYRVKCGVQKEAWYIIRSGHVMSAIELPLDKPGTAAAQQNLDQVFNTSTVVGAEVPSAEMDNVLLVAAWFRRYPDELKNTFTPEEALAILDCRAKPDNRKVPGRLGRNRRSA